MSRVALTATLVAAALAGPLAASAEGMGYTYGEAGYVIGRITDGPGGQSTDGFALGGSVGVLSRFFATASWSSEEVEDMGIDADLDQYSVGFGAHWSLSDRADLVTSVAYQNAEIDFSGAGSDEDDSGYGVSVGVRLRPADACEVEGAVQYEDFDDLLSQASVRVAGRYYFTPMFAVSLNLEGGEDTSSATLGLRVELR
jgi:hypothetical protein